MAADPNSPDDLAKYGNVETAGITVEIKEQDNAIRTFSITVVCVALARFFSTMSSASTLRWHSFGVCLSN